MAVEDIIVGVCLH